MCVCVCVCVCVCYRPPVRAVCPNHEVVMFQPPTVTAPDLGSVANITTIISLQTHLLQPCSGYSFPLLPRPISYRSPILHLLMPLISLFEPAYPLPPPSWPDAEQPSTVRYVHGCLSYNGDDHIIYHTSKCLCLQKEAKTLNNYLKRKSSFKPLSYLLEVLKPIVLDTDLILIILINTLLIDNNINGTIRAHDKRTS